MADFTDDQIALQLTDGFWDSNALASRKFSISPGGTISVDFSSLNADGQSLTANALQAWENVTGINFPPNGLKPPASSRSASANLLLIFSPEF
jgi:serralysin